MIHHQRPAVDVLFGAAQLVLPLDRIATRIDHYATRVALAAA